MNRISFRDVLCAFVNSQSRVDLILWRNRLISVRQEFPSLVNMFWYFNCFLIFPEHNLLFTLFFHLSLLTRAIHDVFVLPLVDLLHISLYLFLSCTALLPMSLILLLSFIDKGSEVKMYIKWKRCYKWNIDFNKYKRRKTYKKVYNNSISYANRRWEENWRNVILALNILVGQSVR